MPLKIKKKKKAKQNHFCVWNKNSKAKNFLRQKPHSNKECDTCYYCDVATGKINKSIYTAKQKQFHLRQSTKSIQIATKKYTLILFLLDRVKIIVWIYLTFLLSLSTCRCIASTKYTKFHARKNEMFCLNRAIIYLELLLWQIVDASEKMKDSIMHLISYSIKEPTEQIASSTCWDSFHTLKYNEQENKVIFILH